jgi:hypothetical protein
VNYSWCFIITSRSRSIGGLIGATWIGLIYANYCIFLGPIIDILIALSWLLAMVIFGRLPLVLWYISGKQEHPEDMSSSWGRAFWGGLAILWLSGMAVGCPSAILKCGPPILISYSITKLSCWHWKCCDWLPERRYSPLIQCMPLPLIESLSSIALAIIILTIRLYYNSPIFEFSSFLIGHGILRHIAIIGHGRQTNMLINALGSSVIATVGVAIFLLAYYD